MPIPLLISLGALLCFSQCGRLNHPAPADTHAIFHSAPAKKNFVKRLRVASYNVHMESAKAITTAIKNNSELRSSDIFLFQEIEYHTGEGKPRAALIAKSLGYNFAYAPGYALQSGGSHGVAIVSRYPLDDIDVIELPYLSTVVNSARRVAIAVTVDLSGQPVRIYSVHLDNRINPQKRIKQMTPVMRAATKFSGPIIITGDLNTSPFCWAVHLIPIPCGKQDNAMEDLAASASLDSPIAGIGATSKWLGMKLDAIYTRGFVVRGRAVEKSVHLSDHYPVWVDLQLGATSL